MKPILLTALFLALGLAQAEEWKQVPVMNHRLTASFPGTLEVGGMNHGLMEPEISQESAQRIFMQVGPTRLLAASNELYAISHEPMPQVAAFYAEQMQRQFKVPAMNVELDTNKHAGLEVAIMTPKADVAIGGAFMLKAAVLRQADGTLQQMSFFTSDSKAENIDEVRAVIDKVITSLAAGQRTLRTGPGTKLGKGELIIDLPPGYTAREEKGVDFTVYNVLPLARPGAKTSVAGIYIGHAAQASEAPQSARVNKIKLLHRDVTWREWEDKGLLRGEAFITEETKTSHAPTIHIFILAGDAASRTALKNTLSTAHLQERH